VLSLTSGRGAIAKDPVPANNWHKLDASETAYRPGSVLLFEPDGSKALLLGGEVQKGAYILAMDPKSGRWEDFSKARPEVRQGMHPYFKSVYDPKTSRVYCIDEGVLFTLDLKSSGSDTPNWVNHGRQAALEGLSWCSAASNPQNRQLVVVGSDKKLENIGWTSTAILDLDSGVWSSLPLPPAEIVREHRELVAAREEAINLVGAIRLHWYRDPQGQGTDLQRRELAKQCNQLKHLPELASLASEFEQLAEAIESRDLLSALKQSRSVQRKVELLSEEQYPVPVSRRNSPLVWDEQNKVFVMFGGDHEDYQMNDTWVLDLAKQSWRRAKPEFAPSPRAGHAMAYLPASGKIALYEGYTASSSTNYRSTPWAVILPRQLWTYDVKTNRWELLKAWDKGDDSLPSPAGQFYGYLAKWFSPPALSVDNESRLVLHAPAGKTSAVTWRLEVDPTQVDRDAQKSLACAPNIRHYRTGAFLAAHCEVDETSATTGLEQLVPNRWIKLPPAPRNVARGCRQRDWSTSVWDSENEQILLWGGGHCVRSASTVVHYSPASGRMVEGYDADEPYGANGGGGFGSSLWNRPWVPTHGYNLYAYDPKARLMVTATGRLYDPRRMDWIRAEPLPRPFHFHWSSTVLESTPHGVVAWAQAAQGGRIGLWLFDREQGWQDLEPLGTLVKPYCDSEGMVYDSKRDRLILGWGGGYKERGDGSLTTFDFATRKLEKILPENIDLGKIADSREMVYVADEDCILFGSEARSSSDAKSGKQLTLVYNCAKNRYLLLDGGEVAYGHSAGWMYDSKQELVHVFTYQGEAYSLDLDLDSATVYEQAPSAK
jgi:hypothetical protein